MDELFNSLDLTQLINEPTHFRENCRPACIDLILTDQLNIVTNYGVRPSLDPTVKHQITYCNLNLSIPYAPSCHMNVWHFDRAQPDLIQQAIKNFNWEHELHRIKNPSDQVNFFNEHLLNILSNFIPNGVKKFVPRDPHGSTKPSEASAKNKKFCIKNLINRVSNLRTLPF